MMLTTYHKSAERQPNKQTNIMSKTQWKIHAQKILLERKQLPVFIQEFLPTHLFPCWVGTEGSKYTSVQQQ